MSGQVLQPVVGPPGKPVNINVLPNELLVRILSYLSSRTDVWSFLLTQRRWFTVGIDQIWLRPEINSASTLHALCATLKTDACEYSRLIRRLNFGAVAQYVTPTTLEPFTCCQDLERLALAGATIRDEAVICELVSRNKSLSSIDFSGVHVSDQTIVAVAQNCKQLHGIYTMNCVEVTDVGISALARNCKYLRRLKIAGCSITGDSLRDVMENCPYMLELDVGHCGINDEMVKQILQKFTLLRELRVNFNMEITAEVLDGVTTCDTLRLIDFGACPNITDSTVERLVTLAPRLHQVVLGKCFNVTNRSLQALSQLEQNLHYVHLGHCSHITDQGVAQLVKSCPRLQYVDVANCSRLTNAAVSYIARLPRLRRVGLVKCTNINDEGILWLARRTPAENTIERIHLSYCNEISFNAVASLVNQCPRLTHLSLTGVSSFLRDDLTQFCRAPPPDLTQHQQAVFCVFSGVGITRLRDYINRRPTPSMLTLFPPTRTRPVEDDRDPPNVQAPRP